VSFELPNTNDVIPDLAVVEVNLRLHIQSHAGSSQQLGSDLHPNLLELSNGEAKKENNPLLHSAPTYLKVARRQGLS
jgi:hypothetical protein